MDVNEAAERSVTYDVQRGRIPITAMLTREAEVAKQEVVHTVKILVSGPDSLVDSAMAESRKINWQLFDSEAFSFSF